MLDENAPPVIFLMASLYGLAIAILYVLARSWEKTLSWRRRSVTARAWRPVDTSSMPLPSAETLAASHREAPTTADQSYKL